VHLRMPQEGIQDKEEKYSPQEQSKEVQKSS
jgi:hypothetical protein